MASRVVLGEKFGRLHRLRVSGFITDAEASEIARQVILAEQDRTQQGLDTQLRRFAPYSPKYAELREELGLITSTVNLNFTGAMLNDLAYKVIDAALSTSIDVYLAREENVKKAVRHITGDEVPERDFHGLDPELEEVVLAMVESFIERKLNRD